MRTTLTLLALIIGSSLLPAQKVLQIEKYGKPQAEKMYIGDPITFQLRNEDVFHSSYIEDIRVEDSLLVLSDRYVNVHNITALRIERTWYGQPAFLYSGSASAGRGLPPSAPLWTEMMRLPTGGQMPL